MRTFVVTPPDPVVSWEEANDRLKLGGDIDQRDDIEAMIAAATGTIDGPTGWLGRAIGEQTLEARLDNFGCGSIVLRYPPLIEIESVSYIDTNGTQQVVNASQYELLGTSLVPTFATDWPSPRSQREAVRVRYTAGYSDVPAQIKTAILLMVGDLYRFRETVAVGMNMGAVPMSTTVEQLLGPLRQFG